MSVENDGGGLDSATKRFLAELYIRNHALRTVIGILIDRADAAFVQAILDDAEQTLTARVPLPPPESGLTQSDVLALTIQQVRECNSSVRDSSRPALQ